MYQIRLLYLRQAFPIVPLLENAFDFKASNTKVNILIGPKVEHVRDLIPLLNMRAVRNELLISIWGLQISS